MKWINLYHKYSLIMNFLHSLTLILPKMKTQKHFPFFTYFAIKLCMYSFLSLDMDFSTNRQLYLFHWWFLMLKYLLIPFKPLKAQNCTGVEHKLPMGNFECHLMHNSMPRWEGKDIGKAIGISWLQISAIHVQFYCSL